MLRKVDSSSIFCNNFIFPGRITTEATACLATNLNSTLKIGCRKARNAAKKYVADGGVGDKFALCKDLI